MRGVNEVRRKVRWRILEAAKRKRARRRRVVFTNKKI